MSEGAEDKSGRDDKNTGDDCEFDDPDVFDWIAKRADETNRDDDVSKGEPVGSVEDERIFFIDFEDGGVDGSEPLRHLRPGGFYEGVWTEKGVEKAYALLDYKGGGTAEDKGEHE